METLDRIRQAHNRAGAPGDVIGYTGAGRYRVRLQHGTREFRMHCLPDGRIRVFASWSIAGCRQRKQATSD